MGNDEALHTYDSKAVAVPADFAERIRACREALELTQAALASRLGVSYATVNRWENRQNRPARLAWSRFLELEIAAPRAGAEASEPETNPALDFLGDPEAALLVAEAERLTLGHIANPTFATETSRVDPLPHQRIAVYDHMLHQQPLRFLLADDAGAGKTVMTGLYIREMLSRRLLHRVLIVPPAGLVGNWRRELARFFGLRFTVIRGHDARHRNPFVGAESDQVIVSIDTLAADSARRRLQEPEVEPYDLVVFDEAHKLSARLDPDGTFRPTDRYRLAEAFAGVRPLPRDWSLTWSARHLLLLTATPHMGKEFPYFCLWRLLEPQALPTPEAFAELPPEARTRHFIRRTKEEMVTLDGRKLYPERVSDTLAYDLSQGEISEQTLYDRVSSYIQSAYNRARVLNRSAARLAMSVFQRRLASSPWALLRSLERRHERLEGLIDDIRSGRITEEDLARGQLRLDREVRDPFETTTADEDEPLDGAELCERAEDRTLGGVVATSLADLEVERLQVAELLDLARAVDAQGHDSKFEELRKVLREPEGAAHKLIVFTEHRDTLEYLVRRLGGLGHAEQLATVHGGMDFEERDRQVEHFRRPTDQGGALILVATDAAGEGINLQFCWRMVNYDLPWNPARLEQRMGRIHRYGQAHDPVKIANLVAPSTREGRVLKTLLDKLDVIREELGNDKVFDVVGRVLEGVSLRDYMARALTDQGADDAAADLARRLTPQGTRAALDRERSCYGPAGDVRPHLDRLRAETERETLRRLLPGYLRRFAAQAGATLGFAVDEEPDATFAFRQERAGALDDLWPVLEQRDADPDTRLTFDAAAAPNALLVHPGEPVFDALCDAVRRRCRVDALRGSVLEDPLAAEPYLLHLLAWRVVRAADPSTVDPADEQLLETGVLCLRQAADGAVAPVQPEMLLLLHPLRGVPPAALPLVARAEGLAAQAVDAAIRVAVESFTEGWRQRLTAALPERLQLLRRGFDHAAAHLALRRSQLRAALDAGSPSAAAQLEGVRAEQRQLVERRTTALDAAGREPGLVTTSPLRPVAHFVVVPTADPEVRARFDADVEAAAIRLAVAHEEALGATVHDVSTPAGARRAGLADWPGFDLLSRRRSGEDLAIEVKGRAHTGSVELSTNEWARACNLRGRYWLYVVYGCASSRPQLLRVQDPFGRLVAGPRGGVVIEREQIVAAAQEVS